MTAKKYLIIRLAVAAILAGIVSSSILTGNYILPIVAVAAFAAFLYTMKKKVKEVMIDERDFAIAGDAARYALNLYAGLAAVAAIILFSLRSQYPELELVGAVLAYSACFLMIAYSMIFKIIYFPEKRKRIFVLMVGLLIVFAFIVFGLRMFSGEDDWICSNGKWVQHGHPRAPMPAGECK